MLLQKVISIIGSNQLATIGNNIIIMKDPIVGPIMSKMMS